MKVTGLSEILIVDLAVDAAPSHRTIRTALGPSYAPEELAGRKTIALFDRAEARDFADVYALAQRFGRETLIARAAEVDAGFDLQIFAAMMRTLDRFADDEIPVEGTPVATLREYFRDWVLSLTDAAG
ncbi:tRNA isopentenyl-2-thiomethyl-A-37 hydroxylase MiaE [Hamadaea flava]|uniref:Nucleotidyl transferase AbiEii/AbiGii toxin family protein n=1 Tax=Hamadaea flava TaxID=1742688 RepID=A0ABV8LH05_9ACTN|nr:nucleotidyl transferase AbiEii/AbiGii toxin family protein [Hamadaea flava]MCP2326320.1 tRNA isopentenyl-2-thiomethyl-A-37 hydroxylase MiaE [Hamadaea flava]